MTRAARLAVLAALTVAASSGAAIAQEPQQPDPERGRALAERWCVECHLVGPEGPGGDVGPAFETVAQTRTEEGLRAWLSNPHPPMPTLDLSAREVDDITAYIAGLAQQNAQ